jgi:hypothetical protein
LASESRTLNSSSTMSNLPFGFTLSSSAGAR